jgi:hypothetical protein
MVVVAGTAAAQGFYARGDATCNVALSAADVVAEVRALGGGSSCNNDDCDRDGSVTPADASCAASCLFGQCLISARAPQVAGVTADTAPSIVPLSAIRIAGTNFGSADRIKRVTIGGREAAIASFNATTDTMEVIVPAGLAPGPADVVVFDGELRGFSSQITIAAPAPIGPPDTFDGTLGLVDTAAALLLALDLESTYSAADAAALRERVQRFRTDLATQRAALAADPNFTPDIRARFDAAFDSSGMPEQLRQLIVDVESLLGASRSRAAVADVITIAVAVSRFAATSALLAAQAGSTAPLLAAPAAPLLGIGLPVVLAIGAIAALVAGGAYLAGQNSRAPEILSIIFEDGNGRSRLMPTAGGVVHVAGKNFLPSADIVVKTAYGEFTAQRVELTDETIAARLPTNSGFCGSASIVVSKALDVRAQPYNTHIQPILNEVRPRPPDAVTPGEEFDLVVRGVAPCDSIVAYKGAVSLEDEETGIEQLPLVTLVTTALPVFPPGNFTARIKVQDIASDEELPFQVGNPITGLTITCTAAELAVPPGSPSTATCTASIEPKGEVPPISSTFVWSSDSGSVSAMKGDAASATITAKKVGSANIHATLVFGTQTLAQSKPDAVITVVDKTGPTISISSTAMATVMPGSSIDVMASASDNVGLGTISLTATGDAVTNPSQDTLECIGSKTCSPSFTVTLKDTDFKQHTVSIQAEAVDAGLNRTKSNTLSFTISGDTTCPVVTIQSPSDGATVNAGDSGQVSALITDNSQGDTGVKRVIVDISGDALVGAVHSDVTLPQALPQATRLVPFSVKQAADLVSILDKTISISVQAFDDAMPPNGCDAQTVTVTAVAMLEQCSGGISVDNASGCEDSPFTITVALSGAGGANVTRVTSINPGGQFDLTPQGGGIYTVTLFYHGQGGFTLTFYAFDAEGKGLCSNSIGLEATGPCPASGAGSRATARMTGTVAGGSTHTGRFDQ